MSNDDEDILDAVMKNLFEGKVPAGFKEQQYKIFQQQKEELLATIKLLKNCHRRLDCNDIAHDKYEDKFSLLDKRLKILESKVEKLWMNGGNW